ncbi:MAG: tRNA dihydrouridine synthase DusB [Bacillota bacterium]
MNIGQIKIENPILVAPMAGVTDYPYRKILRDMGAELLYTEMVSAKGLVYGNQRTEELIKLDNKGYNGVQIFGADPDIMAEAAFIVERDFEADLIDINLGCPAPKIVKNNYGSALMNHPNLTSKIVKNITNSINLPVTVKMRKGWNQNNINAVEIAKICEESGAKAVAIHGRTREEFYTGKADWTIIKDVKETVSIPVIGNGDIFSVEDAERMFDKTNCDGVMLARGIQGNPWLLKKCKTKLQHSLEIDDPNFTDKIKLALRHLKIAVNYYGEKRAIPLMRKHISWYLKGLPHSTKIKDEINRLKSEKEVKKSLKEYLLLLKNRSSIK